MPDFAVEFFFAVLFLPDFFSFCEPEGLLAFFALFPAAFAPFLDDLAPLPVAALEDFDPFGAEVLAEVFFFPVFFEASLDFFFPDFLCADFLPFFFELFSPLDPAPNEGLPFTFGSMVEGLYSSFNRRRYCSWSSRTLSFTWLSSCWAKQPNAKTAEIETTAGNMSILRNLLGTPLLENLLAPVDGEHNRPSIVLLEFLVSVL